MYLWPFSYLSFYSMTILSMKRRYWGVFRSVGPFLAWTDTLRIFSPFSKCQSSSWPALGAPKWKCHKFMSTRDWCFIINTEKHRTHYIIILKTFTQKHIIYLLRLFTLYSKFFTVYTAYTSYTAYTVYTVCTVYTVHNVYTTYVLHC